MLKRCIVFGEAIDFTGELDADFNGEETVEPVEVISLSNCCLDLNIFLSLKQLFEHGNLSCIIDIREKNISDETLVLILQYSS
jgi:hypothetical protein